jgi:hypothetical protein
LDTDYGTISDQKEISTHTVDFYKNLFGSSPHLSVHLSQGFWDEGEKLDDDDKVLLQGPFTERELELAVSGMKTGSASGPNGFTVICFKKNVETHQG